MSTYLFGDASVGARDWTRTKIETPKDYNERINECDPLVGCHV